MVREIGLQHRGRGDGERRGGDQGGDGQQGQREAEGAARRVLAGRLQQREAARRRAAEARQHAGGRGRPEPSGAQHERADQRARHHQQADLLEGATKPRPNALPIDWKVMLAAMP